MTRATAWWKGLPEVQRAIAAGISIGGIAVTLALSLAGYVGLPPRVDVLESDVRTIRETLDRRDRYAFCRWQAEDAGLEPVICRQLLPDNFLPPGVP